MTLLPRTLSLGEAALRIAARPGRGDWFVLLVPNGRSEETADALMEELSALRVGTLATVRHPADANELARRSREENNAILLVSGLEGFSEDEWRHMDLLRSQFQREAGVVLIMEATAAERLHRVAPNLMSWIGSSVWVLAPEAESLSREEREARLRALRQWAKLTDQQVLELAARGQLPADPAYAEWLVLLDRGDLLGT
jgi:hypothetical protein